MRLEAHICRGLWPAAGVPPTWGPTHLGSLPLSSLSFAPGPGLYVLPCVCGRCWLSGDFPADLHVALRAFLFTSLRSKGAPDARSLRPQRGACRPHTGWWPSRSPMGESLLGSPAAWTVGAPSCCLWASGACSRGGRWAVKSRSVWAGRHPVSTPLLSARPVVLRLEQTSGFPRDESQRSSELSGSYPSHGGPRDFLLSLETAGPLEMGHMDRPYSHLHPRA